MQRLFRTTSLLCLVFCATFVHAQSRQYVCAPGLLFCDDFNAAADDVDRKRWREPMSAESRRGVTLFRNRVDTPSMYKLRVENGAVRLMVSSYTPPKKAEPTKKLEQDPPAEKKTPDNKSMEKTAFPLTGPACTDTTTTGESKKTQPDTPMRRLDRKTMGPSVLGSQLITRKAFGPPGAYPYWSAVSISMRARFPGAVYRGRRYGMTLHRLFSPTAGGMPSRNEIDMQFASRYFGMPPANRMVLMNVLNNFTAAEPPEPMTVNAPLVFSDWHVYRMDWGPNYVTWYIDGKRVKRVRAGFQRTAPMHLELSAFMPRGGRPGSTDFTMEVDWVRAQKIATSAVLHPMLKGRAADHCFMKGKHCGRPAADYYCQMKGFDQAGDWTMATRSMPTTHIGDGKACTGSDCKAFATVTCLGGMTERDGPMFRKPMTRHGGKEYRLDWCLSYGKQCGKPVAEAFCRMRGYAGTTGFATERYVSPTHVLDEKERKICTGRICDGFKYIACGP